MSDCICRVIWEPDSNNICCPVRYINYECPQHPFIDKHLSHIPDLWPEDLFKEIDNLFEKL